MRHPETPPPAPDAAPPPVGQLSLPSDCTVAEFVGRKTTHALQSTRQPNGRIASVLTFTRRPAEVGPTDQMVTDGDRERGKRSLLDQEELTILALIADGLSLDSVAVRVGVSSRTIRRRVRGVCDRVGVAHAIQAVVWAARRGLI